MSNSKSVPFSPIFAVINRRVDILTAPNCPCGAITDGLVLSKVGDCRAVGGSSGTMPIMPIFGE